MSIYHKLALGSVAVCGLMLNYTLQKRQTHYDNEMKEKRDADEYKKAYSCRIPVEDTKDQSQAERQLEEVKQLVESLKSKSFREKLEGAYDAATRTHDIGFPLPSKKNDTNKRDGR